MVLPRQSITFQAHSEAVLEVVSGQPVSAMIEARIPCKSLCLQVVKGNTPTADYSAKRSKRRGIKQPLQVLDLSADKTLPEDRGGAAPAFETV